MSAISLPEDDARDYVQIPDGYDVLVWDGFSPPPPGVDQVEFFVAKYASEAAPDALAAMPRLRVVQVLSAGYEAWLPALPDGVLLCNGRGVHGSSTAELAVAGVSSVLRELPRAWRAQAEQSWDPHFTEGLPGARVIVIGAGDIATRIATAVRAFGAEPTLVGRRARDGVAGIDELDELLGTADVVFVAVPLTDDTRHLLDARRLALLPDGAVVANVARGPIVDTDALVAELQRERLRAYLDVTDPEPLPAGHPLWSAPGVLITPHIGGGTAGWQRRAYGLVDAQLRRYAAGEELANVVAGKGRARGPLTRRYRQDGQPRR